MQAAPLLATASVLALALGVAPRALAGEKVRAELRYTRTDDACPDEPTMRALVASRLGYDPFIDGADLTLSIDLRRQGSERVGRIALASKNVARGGERELRALACLRAVGESSEACSRSADQRRRQARQGCLGAAGIIASQSVIDAVAISRHELTQDLSRPHLRT